ncbi:MAG TPA: SMC-Scp complex subunit ScpB [Steroidobacteraceae bacterium]|nr:SMC-Scp complex subunit ScpB [Steroidobacteraceae bacterium]
MNESYIKNVVEAAMLAAGRPLPLTELAALFDETNRPSPAAVRAALASLEQDYAGRGIELKETATGFRIQVRRDVANEVSRLWPERPAKYSRALLETLALIAYRQPITRAEIEAVRGVAVNPNIIKTLLERNWVRVVGNRDVPGRPELLGTTKDFLDYFGLRSLDELPPLAELKAMGDVNLQLDLAKDSAGNGSAAAAGAAGASAVQAGGAEASATEAAAGEAPASAAAGESGGEAAQATVAAGAAEDSGVEDDASVDALLEASEAGGESASVETRVAAGEADAADDDDEADRDERVAELDAQGADEPSDALEAGPQKRAAEAFVAELEADDEAESASGEEDPGDDDELSADSQGSGELVAGPRHLDD